MQYWGDGTMKIVHCDQLLRHAGIARFRYTSKACLPDQLIAADCSRLHDAEKPAFLIR